MFIDRPEILALGVALSAIVGAILVYAIDRSLRPRRRSWRDDLFVIHSERFLPPSAIDAILKDFRSLGIKDVIFFNPGVSVERHRAVGPTYDSLLKLKKELDAERKQKIEAQKRAIEKPNKNGDFWPSSFLGDSLLWARCFGPPVFGHSPNTVKVKMPTVPDPPDYLSYIKVDAALDLYRCRVCTRVDRIDILRDHACRPCTSVPICEGSSVKGGTSPPPTTPRPPPPGAQDPVVRPEKPPQHLYTCVSCGRKDTLLVLDSHVCNFDESQRWEPAQDPTPRHK